MLKENAMFMRDFILNLNVSHVSLWIHTSNGNKFHLKLGSATKNQESTIKPIVNMLTLDNLSFCFSSPENVDDPEKMTTLLKIPRIQIKKNFANNQANR